MFDMLLYLIHVLLGAHKGSISPTDIQLARDICASYAMSMWPSTNNNTADLLTEFCTQPISSSPFGIRPFLIANGLVVLCCKCY